MQIRYFVVNSYGISGEKTLYEIKSKIEEENRRIEKLGIRTTFDENFDR